MKTVNPAVREHLRRIADAERGTTLRWLVWLRVAIVTLYTFQSLYHTVVDPVPEARLTLPLFVLYTLLAGVLALLAEARADVLRLAGYTVGLLDMPMVVLATCLAVPVMSQPTFLLNSALPFTALLLVSTVLTLDYGAIAVATVSAAVGAGAVVVAVGAPTVELEDPVFAMVCIGVTSGVIVSRLRALVVESRRRDFAGRYVLGERLGAGGMAEVFSAVYSPEGSFERRVAVKRVLPAFANDEEFIALFRREAELGAQLAHPNLVQVLDFGRHLDSWFIAMELVEGVSLSALMRASVLDSLPLAARLFIIAEVAEGLAYLHEKGSADGSRVGLVHRDLNPPNVLISFTGEVKVSDFGVARWESTPELTVAGTVRGKLAYVAPEHLRGAPPTMLGDLFALGVLSYELLVGHPLFEGSTEAERIASVLEQPIAPPSAECRDLPPQAEAVVMGLLERDPERRLSSARAVATALRALSGPHAPYPTGRQALARAVATLRPTRVP